MTTAVKRFEDMTPMERRHHNVRVLAERMGWPEGIAERLVVIERCFPAWLTSYARLDTPNVPAGSCTARLERPVGEFAPALVAADPAELAAMVAEEDAKRRDLIAPCPTCKRPRGGAGPAVRPDVRARRT
ncbi:hypothetical protein [Streptomyces sp. NPDC052494]|uniref:hypothetical protein n=1 Tax=Streptomyces sp. NPDC052494 TaxID=3365692 RepID=UPI0037D444ED